MDVVPAYQTVQPYGRAEAVLPMLERGEIDCVTFTSSSTVSNFFSMFDRERIAPLLERTAIACIGPITAETARKHGLVVSIMPADYTIPAFAEAIAAHYSGNF